MMSSKYFKLPNRRRAWLGAAVSLALLTTLVCSAEAAPGASPKLAASTEVSTGGFYRLFWDWEKNPIPMFELQESTSRDFKDARTIYLGRDQATVMSGRENGKFYYRVRAHKKNGVPLPWSDAVFVKVDHHPLSRALSFFGAGALVFASTVGLIVTGSRRHDGIAS